MNATCISASDCVIAESLDLSPLEQQNAALTEAFNSAWSARDLDRLIGLLAADVRYMIYEGGPVKQGPAEVREAVGRFMAKFARIEFSIRRLEVMGSVVIHERTEDYYAPDGELDTHFHVVGLLVIKDGLVSVWRDYSLPGAEQIVGPLCSKKE